MYFVSILQRRSKHKNLWACFPFSPCNAIWERQRFACSCMNTSQHQSFKWLFKDFLSSALLFALFFRFSPVGVNMRKSISAVYTLPLASAFLSHQASRSRRSFHKHRRLSLLLWKVLLIFSPSLFVSHTKRELWKWFFVRVLSLSFVSAPVLASP